MASGIWPAKNYGDMTNVNSVVRNAAGDCLATADDFGEVKLFRYPCTQEGAEFSGHLGHSAHVTKVRWTREDSHLISIGGGDKTVFQWRYVV
jgi:WD40 repeat protein